jgi:two-component system, chemotaxis family, sensor kinase CheA
MNTNEQEYTEIFLAEAQENFTEINRLLTALEKNFADTSAVQALFRITHTLKGNGAGMGFDKIAEMAHIMEDFFGEVRDGKIVLGNELFSYVFKATDALGELIEAVREPKDVKYKGIKAKLEVLIRNARQGSAVTGSHKADEHTSAEPCLGELDVRVENGAYTLLEKEIEEAEQEDKEVSSGVSFSDSVQVPVKKLDNLLNLVGELVIERDRLIATTAATTPASVYARLNRISSDLQYSVMDVRLVQVGFLFNKFHRIVRDASSQENKKVTLRLEGTETEIDRTILQVISDSLIHLIRNCVGHGIERPHIRKEKGKSEEGTITLTASSESDKVFIKIQDNGAGIDPQKIKQKAIEKGMITAHDAGLMADRDLIMLIFEPGFSTMDQVTAISGRGVGMDVVKKAIDSIGGMVTVDSQIDQGTTIVLGLPASMAVKLSLLFELGGHTYAIPLSYTESVISMYKSEVKKASNELVAMHLGDTIHLVFLADLLAASQGLDKNEKTNFNAIHPEAKLEIVVVNIHGRRLGFIVDKLLQQKEIVEKPLRKPVDKLTYISGTTIMGNGHVCLVLNINNILSSMLINQYVKLDRH